MDLSELLTSQEISLKIDVKSNKDVMVSVFRFYWGIRFSIER
jgi:hypothetical protein